MKKYLEFLGSWAMIIGIVSLIGFAMYLIFGEESVLLMTFAIVAIFLPDLFDIIWEPIMKAVGYAFVVLLILTALVVLL